MPVKIGVFTVLYHDVPLEGALDRIAALGVEAVELLQQILPREPAVKVRGTDAGR